MKEYVKYLRVYIDGDLSWKHHIEHIRYPEKSLNALVLKQSYDILFLVKLY